MTAVAILQLVEAGVLSLDDRVASILPTAIGRGWRPRRDMSSRRCRRTSPRARIVVPALASCANGCRACGDTAGICPAPTRRSSSGESKIAVVLANMDMVAAPVLQRTRSLFHDARAASTADTGVSSSVASS